MREKQLACRLAAHPKLVEGSSGYQLQLDIKKGRHPERGEPEIFFTNKTTQSRSRRTYIAQQKITRANQTRILKASLPLARFQFFAFFRG